MIPTGTSTRYLGGIYVDVEIDGKQPIAKFGFCSIQKAKAPFARRQSVRIPPRFSAGKYKRERRDGWVRSGSSNDYQSIINDQMVEIRNLKRELRQYQAMEYQGRHEEKLFEVKVHNVPNADRRRELEETPQAFVTGPSNTHDLSRPRHDTIFEAIDFTLESQCQCSLDQFLENAP